jgi:ribosome-binding ATPase YchF (GTP1/OBG family)
MKKMIYGLNRRGGADNFDTTNPDQFKELLNIIAENNSNYVLIDAKIEDELKDFEGAERQELRQALVSEASRGEQGEIEGDGIDLLIKNAYTLLDLETYFTTGLDETRAWTIKKGSTAPIAGMAIHTDFKDKFIRAEIIFWQDLLDLGSYAEARAQGKLMIVGKDYIVKDGDVIEFKI